VDVHAAKEHGSLHVIAFVGVNGVGRSTNLAKVCISRHHTTTIKIKRETFIGIFIQCLYWEHHRLFIGFFSIPSV
jgi:hypothetical protein